MQQCRVELLARLFGQAERAEATFHARRGTEHDAFPDQRSARFGFCLLKAAALAISLSKAASRCGFRRGVVCCRPVGLYGQQLGIKGRWRCVPAQADADQQGGKAGG
jgi:hypothetical protein